MNEEFDFGKDKFTKSPLVIHIAKEISSYYLRVKEPNLNNQQIIKSKSEIYLHELNDELSEILNNLDDLELIRNYLIDLSPPTHDYYDEKHVAKHIRYHIENYIIRVYKFKDQLLSLIKTILQLQITHPMRLKKEVLSYIKDNNLLIGNYLHLIDQLFDPIKPHRNSLAHTRRLKYSDLSMLEITYDYKLADDENHQMFIEMQRSIVSRIINDLDIYLKNVDTLLKVTCVTLQPSFINKYKELGAASSEN